MCKSNSIKNIIRKGWKDVHDRGGLTYIEKDNKKLLWEEEGFTFEVNYNPNRGGYKPSDAISPWLGNLTEHKTYIMTLDEDFTVLANYIPALEYQILLVSTEYREQHDYTIDEDIRKISRFAEETGIRIFLNSLGTGASVNHLHFQGVFSEFPLEILPIVKIDENIGYLKGWGGNVLFEGDMDTKLGSLAKTIDKYKNEWPEADRTIRNDGQKSEIPLFTLLFWENKILFLPRRRETPSELGGAKAGGLEVSGNWIITKEDVYANIKAKKIKLMDALREVTFEQAEVNKFFKLHKKEEVKIALAV